MTEFKEHDLLNANAAEESEKKSFFTFQTIWTLFYLNWYWVILSIIICMSMAYVYLKYTDPTYSASMKVLIKEGQDGKGRGMAGNLSLEELGMMSASNGFDNELEIIRSVSVSTRAVRQLKLYVSYIAEGRITDREIYKSSPILVDLEEGRLDKLEKPVKLEISKKGNGIYVEGRFDRKDPSVVTFARNVTSFPAHVQSPYGQLIFQRNPGHHMTDKKLYVTIRNPKEVARGYAGRLNAKATTKTTTVAVVSFTDTKKERAIDFLTELVGCYNDDANEDKNEVARKTEQFIANRIDIIRQELDSTEGNMEHYKRKNELINLANDASSALSQSTSYQKEQVEIQTQISLIRTLMDYMDSPNNYLQIIPANLGLTNAALTKMIDTYNELVMKRHRYLKGSSEDHPTVVQVTQQAQDLWPVIRSNMNNIYNDMQIQKSSADSQYDLFTGRISETPTQERVLTNIGRQQELKAGLYLTLLQKREENYIQLASTATKARMIDEPVLGGQVSPNTKIIWTGAFAIGFFFPLALFFGLSFLRYRIEGRDDVERLTDLAILADIPFAHELDEEERAVVVRENRNNMMEECFRGLRTNLNFVLEPGEKVIICTSCIPGEGKTFVATNMAMSLALLGKKVLVMGVDIRKPQLVKLFGLKAEQRGITNYLVNPEPDYELLTEQIYNSGINPNLFVLPAGVIPPNPAELLSRPMLQKAVEFLKERFDYIIMDTAPVGLVSDTLNMGHFADMTIFVARADYSPKANFQMINDIAKQNKLPKCNIVLNGMDLEKRKYGYYYGYGKYGNYGKYGRYGKYGYGYGYRYGSYGTYGAYGHGKDDGKSHGES
ncbi:MAG: polysaccharide biosynthesis tyrosine autokinase [Bacteroidaceae bacterium]|nr:polysaccharide biosynthesis tyrosine autokinase [Bacteroidaceae bacterium]